jgi:hypothetical protein
MVDAVEPDQAYHDEVDGDDVIQQPWHEQNQNASDKGDDRSDVTGGENHFQTPRMVRMIGLATNGTPDSCTAAECDATAFGGVI